MALDFPTGPATNQIYTSGGKSWQWTGVFWNSVNQGIQGIQGITGAQGTQGQQGIQGTIGAQGTQGQQGITGAGTQGTQGQQGITGNQGTIGAQGTQGQQGITGTQGTQGQQGIQGTLGQQGITGSGAQGTQGQQGITGSQGTQGIQGIKGTKVSSSETAPASPSVNDFWWDSGNGVLMVYYDDGTSQQWVSAMSGITGIQGTAGANGSASSIDTQNDISSNSTFYPVIVAGAGTQTAKTSTKFTFNPSSGDFSTTGNVTAYFSDDRLKDRQGNITDAMNKVDALNGFYFIPNEKAQSLGYRKKLEIGVSAQEVEAILPEIVTQAPVDASYKTVYYDRLIPLLIEALKEQNAVIRQIKDKLVELGNKCK